MVDPSKNVPLRVSGIYLLFGIVWIFLSDVSIFWTGVFDASGYLFSLCKGTLFVVVSSISLYLLMRQQLRQVNHANALAHAVINGTTDAVFVKDPGGRYLMFNHAAAQYVGKKSEDVIGNDDDFLFDAASAAAVKDRDQRIMESGVAETAEEVLSIGNATRIYSATKAPYRDGYGKVIGLIGVSRDITDKIEAEKLLRIERDRLSSIVDSVPVVICSFKSQPDGTVSFPFCSARIEYIYGLSSEELAEDASQIFKRIHPEDVHRVVETVNTSAQTMTIWECEYRVCRPELEDIWVEGRSTPTRLEDGSILWHGYVADITARKQIKEELKLSEERLRLALESAGGGVWDWDLSSDHAWWSPEMYSLWGVDPSQSMRLANSLESIHEDDRELVRTASQRAIETASEYHAEFRIRHPARGECWIASRGKTICGSNGSRRLIGISQDISDRRRLEEHLHQSQKMEAVGRLAGGVAHDFNNLLTVINGYCRMLVDQFSEPSDPRNSLLAIQDAADRATRLTRQLLSFSRQAMVELQVRDLNQIVSQTSTLLKRLVGDDISLELKLASSECFIEADPIQIDQVILNLTVNARDASAKGSVVTIATRNVEFSSRHHTTTGVLSPGEYIELTVSDQGVGMCDDVKAKIFEPFYSTKERDKGTGLGLAVVHGIITQTGGQIDVESELGHGSIFRIYFREISPKPETLKSSIPAVKGGQETILLVEDERAIRILLERTLQARGYQVLAASSGNEAIELFSQAADRIDILVTDYLMPKMSGRELAECLRSQKPQLLVLFISGYSDEFSTLGGLHSGVDAFLQKPFLPIELANKVRSIMDEGRVSPYLSVTE